MPPRPVPSTHPAHTHHPPDGFAQLLAQSPIDGEPGWTEAPSQTGAGSVPPPGEAPGPTWKSLSSTMCGWRMVFRISISVSRFSTDARLRLLLFTHLMATTSRVSLCQGHPTLQPPPAPRAASPAAPRTPHPARPAGGPSPACQGGPGWGEQRETPGQGGTGGSLGRAGGFRGCRDGPRYGRQRRGCSHGGGGGRIGGAHCGPTFL